MLHYLLFSSGAESWSVSPMVTWAVARLSRLRRCRSDSPGVTTDSGTDGPDTTDDEGIESPTWLEKSEMDGINTK